MLTGVAPYATLSTAAPVATALGPLNLGWIAGLTPITVVAELVNIGALSAFALVTIGVIVLRRLEPDRERPFRVPLMPVVPLLALAGVIALAVTLSVSTWVRFVLWVAAGLVVYLCYGRRNAARVAAASRRATD